METIPCPLCSATAYTHCLTSIDIVATRQLFDVVQCRECGFYFTNPRPTFEEISGYYPGRYYSYQKPAASISSRVSRHGRKFLDIGCGAGRFMIQKINQGYDAFGIEISPAAIARGQSLGLSITRANGRSLEYEDEFFDEIRLHHVLEHLHNLGAMVAEVHRCLKKGGRLDIEVPNLASFDARIYGRSWRYLELPRHLYHFSPGTLTRLLATHNFSNIRIRTWNADLLDRHLYYLKGSYTAMRTAYALQTGGRMKRGIASLTLLIGNLIRYRLHIPGPEEGNLLSASAGK